MNKSNVILIRWAKAIIQKKKYRQRIDEINQARKKQSDESGITVLSTLNQMYNAHKGSVPLCLGHHIKNAHKGSVPLCLGHHIKNVKDHPEMAGVSDNVEFVKKNSEHLERHNGNYRNKTEGELIKRK